MLALFNFIKQNLKLGKIFFFTLIAFIITFSLSSKNNDKNVLLYAPISLSEVINEVINSNKKLKNKIKVKPVFMGTSQLVMQIKNGASPDIFISANEEWMDYLERKKKILKEYRRNYLYNSLVVITNKKNNIKKIKNVKELEKNIIKQQN